MVAVVMDLVSNKESAVLLRICTQDTWLNYHGTTVKPSCKKRKQASQGKRKFNICESNIMFTNI
jgi:hypothetical protein